MRSLGCLLLVPTLFLCAGCAWYWDEPHKNSPRYRVDAQALESIVVGSTTMEEVLLRFGEPQEHFDAPTVFLYRWIRLKGFAFLLVGVSGAAGAEEENTVEYTLHIAFDENDTVARYNVSKVVLQNLHKR